MAFFLCVCRTLTILAIRATSEQKPHAGGHWHKPQCPHVARTRSYRHGHSHWRFGFLHVTGQVNCRPTDVGRLGQIGGGIWRIVGLVRWLKPLLPFASRTVIHYPYYECFSPPHPRQGQMYVYLTYGLGEKLYTLCRKLG